jgi:biopolymer transport protein ExbD
MAFDSNGGDGSPVANINVTPLVDVVLVLLVVLMVAAAGAISEALPLDLPEAGSGGQQASLLRVGIAADGRLSIDGAAIDGEAIDGKAEGSQSTPVETSLKAVQAAAARAVQNDKSARAAIAADGGARHKSVIAVMDALRKGGISKLAIQVSPEATQ